MLGRREAGRASSSGSVREGFAPGEEAVSSPVGSEVGLLDTRGSAGRLRGANVSCAGVIGQGLEERPGRGSVKRQAKGLGLEFSGTREPLMISESVGDLINICAREAGMGGRPGGIPHTCRIAAV